MFKNGEYVIYHNTEYIYRYCFENKPKNMVRLVSYDRQSLNDGFYTNRTEEYMQEHGFRCFKDVPRSKITEAYEIRTYALYRNIEFNIYGSKDNQIRIVRYCSSGRDDELAKKLQTWQFSVFDADKFHVSYDSYISVDDPELEIIEKRTELDISKL